MEVEKTKLEGVKLVRPSPFEDFRGLFIETYNRELYARSGIGVEFVQDDVSVSYKDVLRGLHGDGKTWKLVTCLYGEVYLVVVNWNAESHQFKQWDSFALSDRNHLQVLIPPQFANGYLVLSDMAIFHYKQSTYYQRDRQFALRWNDPELNIRWPVKDPILSERDGG